MERIFYLLVIPLFLLVTSSCSSSTGQETPDAVKTAFEQKYSDAKEVEWTKDTHGYHEASFESDGESYRADYEKDGTWVETESSIDYDDLPEAVKAVIKKDYDKDDIAEIEAVDNAKKGKFYDVEFKDKGKNKDVEITASGDVIN